MLISVVAVCAEQMSAVALVVQTAAVTSVASPTARFVVIVVAALSLFAAIRMRSTEAVGGSPALCSCCARARARAHAFARVRDRSRAPVDDHVCANADAHPHGRDIDCDVVLAWFVAVLIRIAVVFNKVNLGGN